MSYVNIDDFRGKNDKRSHNEALQRALKEFKKKVKQHGTLEELRNRSFHRSPGEARRFKRSEAKRRRKIEERRSKRKNSNKI